jgi:galactokinase
MSRTKSAFAPGRVNLIGDHTDYNEGLALPMAIQLGTSVRFQPSEEGSLVLGSEMGSVPVVLAPDLVLDAASICVLEPEWARIAAGVIAQYQPRATGRLEITSTLPIGAGLSSSASLCVALALALGVDLAARDLASFCQRAEAMAGSSVGLLDPTAIINGEAGHGLLIDFSSGTHLRVPLSSDCEFLVVDSGITRNLADSPYGQRRVECQRAAAQLGTPLGRASLGDLDRVEAGPLRQRARHVITECQRVREFARDMSVGDLAQVGEIMTASHRSLANDFASSHPAIDELVDYAIGLRGVYGARITGGGFGGCIVVLTEPGALALDQFGQGAWRVFPSGGARLID